MTNRIAINEVFAVPAYRQATSPEGEKYEYKCGENIVAYVVNGRTRDAYLYVGRGYDVPICFENPSLVLDTLEAIQAKGSINPDYWYHYNRENLDSLPDYVLNPHRPEYN